MAQTSGGLHASSRMTPWGEQHWDDGQGRWKYLKHVSHDMQIRGKWLRETESPGQCRNCGGRSLCSGHDSPSLTIPQHGLLAAFRTTEEIEASLDFAERPNFKYDAPAERSQGRCVILDLPVEIMRQILDDFIPSGHAYQFLPSRDQKQAVEVVTKLAPGNEPADLMSAHLALAATCRELQKLVYSIVYGENTFAFHISATPIRTQIRSDDFRRFQAWNRVLRHPPQPFGPITPRAAAYLHRATLIIALTVSHGTKDVAQMEKLVAQATEILTHCERLQHLTIHFQLASRVAQNDDVLKIDHLDAVVVDGKLQMGIRDPEVEPVRRGNKGQKILQPLFKLRRVREVVLSGSMTEDSVEGLEALTQPTDTL